MQRVINPYNFISFGKDIHSSKSTREDAYRNGKELKSGWLEVKLLPKTPLIVPDGAHPLYIDPDTNKVQVNPSEKDARECHKKYGFMNRTGADGVKEYYIPGSSIRGMIRSVYEAATDSCVPFLLADKNKPISQRVPLYAALKQRGLLAHEFDKQKKGYIWRLYSTYADIETVTIEERSKEVSDWRGKPKKISTYHLIDRNGQEITIPTGKYVKNRGVIQYNIPVDTSKEYHVAYLKKKDMVHEWAYGDDEPYRLLNSVLCRDNVKGNQANRNKKPANDLKDALDKIRDNEGMVPVYYFKVTRRHENYDEELVYLSNSSAGRIAQKRRWADIMADHKPCSGEMLCPACLLFGALGTEHGLKSHVRFTDALPEKGYHIQLEDKLLDVLGEPRTSAFEFYLNHPEGASYWNFDFYGMTEKDINGVSHTRYYDIEEALPRGRKMYWHGKPRTGSKQTKLNATMAAVEGTPFRFRIYFDEITQEQLQSLIWVITLGENDENSCHQHKLGHAKPLGYGSVKLVITGGMTRSITTDSAGIKMELKPVEISKKPGEGIDLEKTYVQELLRMSDVNAASGTPVTYPTGPDGKIYSWFSENRVRADEVRRLPKPCDEDISIKVKDTRPRKTNKGHWNSSKNETDAYRKGDGFSGKVTGFHKDGFGMYVKLENGDRRDKFVFYRNTYIDAGYGELEDYFSAGTRVNIEYRGINKGKEQWYVTDKC